MSCFRCSTRCWLILYRKLVPPLRSHWERSSSVLEKATSPISFLDFSGLSRPIHQVSTDKVPPRVLVKCSQVSVWSVLKACSPTSWRTQGHQGQLSEKVSCRSLCTFPLPLVPGSPLIFRRSFPLFSAVCPIPRSTCGKPLCALDGWSLPTTHTRLSISSFPSWSAECSTLVGVFE